MSPALLACNVESNFREPETMSGTDWKTFSGEVLSLTQAETPKRGHAGAFPPVLSVENRQVDRWD